MVLSLLLLRLLLLRTTAAVAGAGGADDALFRAAAAALRGATQNGDWPGAPGGLGAVPAGRSASWPVRPGLHVQRTCTPLDFGAKGDNATDDTIAVQRAIDSCSTVVFVSGLRFLVGSVLLNHSNLHLHFEANASAILKPRDPHAGFIAWCSGCVYENITVTGASQHTSVIDGQGQYWWSLKPRPASKPKLLVLHNVRRVHVSGILFRNSPSFHLLVRGDRLSITSCRVEAGIENCDGYGPQPNTDAFHTHGTNIYISDCWVHNGDDGFPIEPAGYGEDTRNVLVENCHA
jgi:polygalacturonase